MSSRLLLGILVGVALLIKAESKFEVSNFAQLGPALEDEDLKDIPYSIANFGFAPLGKTMVAHLRQTPGLDEQCSMNSNATFDKSLQNSFLLIPRGGCPFVTKSLHAQELGAKMVIIMDNENHDRKIIMKDNGYGYKVTIPCIFINFKMGEKLKSLLNRTTTDISLKISFDTMKSEIADVTIFMQAFKRQSYYFVEQFKPFYQKIAKQVNLTLAYDVMSCMYCSEADCFNELKYCSTHYKPGQSASGQLVLNQQLREQIMFEKHRSDWWDYLECFELYCSVIAQSKQCSDTCLLSKTNVKPEELEKELQQSFDYKNENAILKRNQEIVKFAGVQVYPSVLINGVRVKGTVNAEFVFDDICNALVKPPRSCAQYLTELQFTLEVTHTYWITIVTVLIACALLFAILFIFCRRRMRKRMAFEMQGRVDDMVSKYVEFYSERNKK